MKRFRYLKNKSKELRVFLCLLSFFTLYACHTIEGVGTDIKQGGSALERSAEHAQKCSPVCPCCKQ